MVVKFVKKGLYLIIRLNHQFPPIGKQLFEFSNSLGNTTLENKEITTK